MRVVAIIPARGGSKRIPRKNVLRLAGRPLLAYSVLDARGSSAVDRVIVSTEDDEVAAVAENCGAEVFRRPIEIAGDFATSESALAHVLARLRAEPYEPDLIVFLQCTSPVRAPDDIDRAVEHLVAESADSLFSACESDKYIWRRSGESVEPLNYDYRARWRDQDFPEEYRENGSIYVFRPWVLDQLSNRLGGKITVFTMDYWNSFQVDSPEDVELCEWILLRRRRAQRERSIPAGIRLIVFDFDGVFTDNRVLVHEDGREAVICDRADSLQLAALRACGVDTVVLSTETNAVVNARCRKLGMACHQGVADKAAVLAELLAARGVTLEETAYVGNDLNDLTCFRLVGLPIAVADAHPQIVAAAKLVLDRSGGRGAVREVCDLMLAAVNSARTEDVAWPLSV